jgi:3-dehydroquinate dehydratase/shikimate dehydrogenase
MTDRAELIATLTESPSEERLAELSSQADCLEVRADLVPDIGAGWLREHFSGELLYTLRSRSEGGESDFDSQERLSRLAAAAEEFDLIDLEGVRDLQSDLLAVIPEQKRLISWHGPAIRQSELKELLESFLEQPARYYKLIPSAEKQIETLQPLALLHSYRRGDLIAFASGVTGSWTRLIAPRLGAPVVFGGASALPGAPGQLSLTRLRNDFGLPSLPQITDLFGIVGNPVDQSLSPAMHNAAYGERGISALYLPFHVESFGDFWLDIVEGGSLEVLGFDLRGLSVTAPHKRIAAAVAGAVSPRTEHIGSANTLVRRGRVWEADTTDSVGILQPLLGRGVSVKDRTAAIVGVGGAGRAAAYALMMAGSKVTLVNRGVERGERAARELDLPFEPLSNFVPADFDLLINATSLGRYRDDPLPFELKGVESKAVIIDLVYRRDRPTPLVEAARQRGLSAIDGREVLLEQALPQFHLMTGLEMPKDSIHSLIGLDRD